MTNVAFIGNPNCGKTTLFNAYTGAKLKVANWPGVTVEKKEGAFRFHNGNFKLVDLPGIYSLTSYTMEEIVSRDYILSDEVDVIVDVIDASALERNLYLALQLIELGKPVVLAFNMMDIVKERGMEIDFHRLPEMLGTPVIPISARKRSGLDILMHTVAHHKENDSNKYFEHHHEEESLHKHDHHKEFAMVYSDEIEDKIDVVSKRLSKKYKEIQNVRWHSIKILERDAEILKKYPIETEDILTKNYETEIINQKYDFIHEVIHECLVNKTEKEVFTDKIDRLLTNRFLGLPIFLMIMAVVFFLTFRIGDALKEVFAGWLDIFSAWSEAVLLALGTGEVLTSLIVEGIIAGVGGILTFLPNIFILFLALAFLEDSGYMARVAYVMDGIMEKVGLSGKAFIPMVLGFGCTVPAVMASRTLENPRDRLKTIFITPFMSCSAKIPIYVLFSGMFFPENPALVAFSMYVIGLVLGIVVALVMDKLDKKSSDDLLLIELPEYKTPSLRTVIIYVWSKIKDYLTKAGTTIFVASIILWGLLNFNVTGLVADSSESFGAQIGAFIVPALKPAGLGYWQIAVALIAGLAAKEVVVSSMSVLYGIEDISSNAGMSEMMVLLAAQGFGALNAFCLMIFSLLYVPCVAAVATIRKETNSTKHTVFSIVFQLFIAWVMATLVYQVGSLFVG
ncbi:MAG: ferrous iron transport protein B [Clostridia bacterium]|nr:ferrous iron transport protein B [Clostridia bacterium]